MTLVHEAKWFAYGAHAGQKYGDEPYGAHLRKVFLVLQHFGVLGDTLLAAAYLHDTLEDTNVEYKELEWFFGKDVADLVLAVTDRPGRNRKERHAATYNGIRDAGFEAIVLKLADRIANVETSVRTKDRRLSMYREEHPAFKAALLVPAWASPNGQDPMSGMWRHLDNLLKEAP